MALILGIDRFMSEARALVNVIGNGVATIVIARTEGELDPVRLYDVLDARMAAAAETMGAPAALIDDKPLPAHNFVHLPSRSLNRGRGIIDYLHFLS